jgi:hypothetical protein
MSESLEGKELATVLHALGLDNANQAYRNRYVANPYSEKAEMWGSLCKRGLATNDTDLHSVTPYFWFSVTEAGIMALPSRFRECIPQDIWDGVKQ